MSSVVAGEGEGSTERCPWCDSVIQRSKFIHIQEKIADLERRKLAEERALIEARVMAEAARKLAALASERDHVRSQLGEAEARENSVREQATAEAEARMRAEGE